MDILAVQQRLIENGYQFVEHIFNDGWDCNCMVKITKDKDCHFGFDCGGLRCADWGRYPRHETWKMIAKWIDEQEAKGRL